MLWGCVKIFPGELTHFDVQIERMLAEMCIRKSDAGGCEVIDKLNEPARRRHPKKMQQNAAVNGYARRHQFSETPFAVIKAMFDMRRFLLRGIEGVGQEWQWIATAFNLKKLMRIWETLRTLPKENAVQAEA